MLFVVIATSAVAFFPKTGVTATILNDQGAPTTSDRQLEAWWLAFPRISVPVPTDGAVVVIVKFTDYQCPACGQTFLRYGPVIAKYQTLYPGKVPENLSLAVLCGPWRAVAGSRVKPESIEDFVLPLCAPLCRP